MDDRQEKTNNGFLKNPAAKKWVGAGLIILGLLALITPFTPGSWLIFVGLELFGIRLAAWDKIKSKFNRPKK